MSMEEEAARQAAANPPPPPPPGAAAPTAGGSTATAVAGPGGVSAQPTDENEEAILQQALALSEGRAAGPDVEMTEDRDGDENLSEEEMIARAIEMSMRPEPESEEKK